MGDIFSILHCKWTVPEYIPDVYQKPTFDPQFGFDTPRKPRESKISLQEMKALKMDPKKRDYCAHIYKDYLVCRRRYLPFHIFCEHDLQRYEHCQHEDMMLRFKEYEREKRLRLRELKKKKSIS